MQLLHQMFFVKRLDSESLFRVLPHDQINLKKIKKLQTKTLKKPKKK